MIIPKISGDDTKTIRTLQAVWQQRTTREVLTRALNDSFELYLGATEYLAMSMLMYQPKMAESIKTSKSETFWTYTAESLFDSATLLAFNLFDDDKNLNFKNLLTIQKHITLLPNTNIHRSVWKLDPLVDQQDQIARIENRRTKNIAHHERKGHTGIEWGDLIAVLDYARDYIYQFHLEYMDTDFSIPTLQERALRILPELTNALKVEDIKDQKQILEQLQELIRSTQQVS